MRIDLTGAEQEQRKSPARSSPPVPLVVAVRKSHPVASALFCCGCCRVHKDYDYRSVIKIFQDNLQDPIKIGERKNKTSKMVSLMSARADRTITWGESK